MITATPLTQRIEYHLQMGTQVRILDGGRKPNRKGVLRTIAIAMDSPKLGSNFNVHGVWGTQIITALPHSIPLGLETNPTEMAGGSLRERGLPPAGLKKFVFHCSK